MTQQSNEVNELFKALCAAQKEMRNVAKDSKGYNYTYADLPSLINAIRDPLTKHGLCFTQTNDERDDGQIVVVTTLGHESGQWIRGRFVLPPVPPGGRNNAAQAAGSAMSYARRYALAAIVGIAQDDDDGQQLTEPKKERQQPRSRDYGERRNGGVRQRPKPDLKPKQTEKPSKPAKPRGRLRMYADVNKFFPGIEWKRYRLKSTDYLVKQLKETDGLDYEGDLISQAIDWQLAARHFGSPDKNGTEWKSLDDWDRALVLIAERLIKKANANEAAA